MNTTEVQKQARWETMAWDSVKGLLEGIEEHRKEKRQCAKELKDLERITAHGLPASSALMDMLMGLILYHNTQLRMRRMSLRKAWNRWLRQVKGV